MASAHEPGDVTWIEVPVTADLIAEALGEKALS